MIRIGISPGRSLWVLFSSKTARNELLDRSRIATTSFMVNAIEDDHETDTAAVVNNDTFIATRIGSLSSSIMEVSTCDL